MMRFLTILVISCSSTCFALPPLTIKTSVDTLNGRGTKTKTEYYRGDVLILTRSETRDANGTTVIIIHSIKLHGKPIYTTTKRPKRLDCDYIPIGRMAQLDLNGDMLADFILIYDELVPQSYEAFWVAPSREIRPVPSEALTSPKGKLIDEETFIQKATSDPTPFQK